MSERTEISQLVVTKNGEFGDVDYTFFFQAVDGEVLLGHEVKTRVAGKMKLKESAVVTLTIENARKVAQELECMANEAREQEEKTK